MGNSCYFVPQTSKLYFLAEREMALPCKKEKVESRPKGILNAYNQANSFIKNLD